MSRKIDTIIIHCAATKPSMDVGLKEIDQWHRAKGYFGIGYHYVIRRNGEIEVGRPLDAAGAHAKGHNANSIGICLVGGLDDNGNPACNYTESQWAQLEYLVNALKQRCGELKVIGHNDVAAKACPCFSVLKWLEGGMKPLNA